jgi:hypothetical protein
MDSRVGQNYFAKKSDMYFFAYLELRNATQELGESRSVEHGFIVEDNIQVLE